MLVRPLLLPSLGTGCFYIFSPICQMMRKATVSKQQQVSPTPRSVGQKRGNWVGEWCNGKRGGSRFVCVLSVWKIKMRACRFYRMPSGYSVRERVSTTGVNVLLMRVNWNPKSEGKCVRVWNCLFYHQVLRVKCVLTSFTGPLHGSPLCCCWLLSSCADALTFIVVVVFVGVRSFTLTLVDTRTWLTRKTEEGERCQSGGFGARLHFEKTPDILSSRETCVAWLKKKIKIKINHSVPTVRNRYYDPRWLERIN